MPRPAEGARRLHPRIAMPNPPQRHQTRGLTEGAILAALTVVVGAVGLVAPFVGILLAPLPIMLLVIRWGLRTAVLASIVAALILFQFFGPLNAVSITAMFAPLGLALGWGVWRGVGAQLTILAGAAAFLASTIAALALTTLVLHQDLIGQFVRSQVQAMQLALSMQQRIGAPAQQVEEMRKTIAVMPQFLHTALPVMFALGALVWAYLCYALARAVLRRVGHELPGVPPILAWRLPPVLASTLLWIAAGLSLLSLRGTAVSGAALDVMLVNLFVFGFQGALVAIVWANRRQIPRFAQIMAGVLLITAGLMPILALAVLGMLDTWFDYRRLIGVAVTGQPAASSDADGEAASDGAGAGGQPRSRGAVGADGVSRKNPVKAAHPR